MLYIVTREKENKQKKEDQKIIREQKVSDTLAAAHTIAEPLLMKLGDGSLKCDAAILSKRANLGGLSSEQLSALIRCLGGKIGKSKLETATEVVKLYNARKAREVCPIHMDR